MRSSFRGVVTAAMLAIGLSSNWVPLSAQTVNGTILGVVNDPQGGPVAKANVSARSLDTGVVRTTTSEDGGLYRIGNLPAGSYAVTASANGFKTETRTGIIVTVGADTTVNFAMALGAVTDTVSVTAEAPQVDATTSTGSGFANSITIGELPLNGRDWLQLALLEPGVSLGNTVVESDASRSQRGYGIAINIAGGRDTDNAFRIDGLIVNDYANSGPGSSLQVNLGVDAIREFSVLTSNFSAEYGRSSGGIINAITKSGTNDIHGSAYDFIRNSDLDARNFFDGKSIPPFRRNQFGGSVGGPIRKDKTFFFANFERLGELESLSSSVSTLSANAHNGILCANTGCSQTTQVAVNPDVAPYLALYPVPNGAVSGNTGIFQYAAPMHGTENYVIGKIDQYFSPMTTLSASYSYDNALSVAPDNFDLKLASNPSRRQNAAINLQHLFSANVINNFRVGVARDHAGGNIDTDPMNAALDNPALGFLPGRNMGNISIAGVTGVFGGIGSGNGLSALRLFGYTAPQAGDDVSWTKGRHNIRIGSSFERIDYNVNSADKPNGLWTFSSIQNFLQGVPSLFNGDFPGTDSIRGERMSIVAGYIQDDYRLRPNFTINLGVRYEMGTVVKEINGKTANLRDLTSPAVTIGNPYYQNPTLKNFAPRVGFAWDPFKDGKTAIRGGFAIFDIVPLPYLFITRMPRSTPFSIAGVLNNPPPSSFPDEVFQLLTPVTQRAVHIQYNPDPSYKAEWNLTIQRQLARTLVLTTAYVGSAGVHLAHTVDDADQVPTSLVTWNGTNLIFPVPLPGQAIQRINPNFGQIESTDFDGHSSYNSLQVNLMQRPLKGLTYQVAYTWSKSMDNGSTSFGDAENQNTSGPSYAFYPAINRGVSDFNIPQNMVANFHYDIPIAAAFKSNVITKFVFGGWQVGGIYTIQTGAPFTLKLSSDEADTGNSLTGGVQGGQRPNYVNAPGCNPDATTGNINDFIKTQCFAFPAPGVLGNLGRNTLHMPTFHDLDFSLFKTQTLGERLKVQFRAEMFNILNYANIQAQTLAIFNGSGQLIPSVVNAQGATVNTSRQIQFGLKLQF